VIIVVAISMKPYDSDRIVTSRALEML
jgi:hypothetical protein